MAFFLFQTGAVAGSGTDPVTCSTADGAARRTLEGAATSGAPVRIAPTQEGPAALNGQRLPAVADPGLPAVGRAMSLGATIETHLKRYFDRHGDDLPPPGLHERILREVERPLIELCLAATGGNQLKASTVLGLNRNTLRKKMKELGISPARRAD